MIDFVKYQLTTYDKDTLLNSPLLVFFDKVNNSTGEIAVYQNAYFRGLEFKIYYPTNAHPKERITVEGSYHKYWNNGSHNFNDFNIHNIYEVLKDLELKFNINPNQCRLIQLEIGINILPPIKSKTIVKGCMFYKTTQFKSIYTKDEGNYNQVKAQRFFVKIYDKRTHYQNKGFKIDNEILRIEKKYSKSEELHKLGIYTMQDLINYGLNNFKPMLLDLWNNTTYYDKKLLKDYPNRYNYNSIDYWQGLTKRQRKYQLEKLNNLYKQNRESMKNIVSNLISRKVDCLNSELYQINPLHIELKQYNLTVENKYQNQRVCVVTGLNISMQKKGSFLLSHTGLKYYFNTDLKIYKEVKRKYLSDKWQKSNFEVEVKEIAHNIRNHKSNRDIKQFRIYPLKQNNLLESYF